MEEAITVLDNYFIQRIDVVGARGLSSLLENDSCIENACYGTAADAIDDYVRTGESTAIESLKKFAKAVVNIFGTEYLIRPNGRNMARLLAENEARGMLGSINYRSDLFNDLAEGRGPNVRYTVNWNEYNMIYGGDIN
ncbi:uncharacterized protein LOC141674519 [Apium graveolens]|uniref:uncharacterized protein LOC141674519 n=1 Tax=Apium graveolens TaxID=4045 RepID=UPI003D7C0BA3